MGIHSSSFADWIWFNFMEDFTMNDKTPAIEAMEEITAFEIKNGPSNELSFKTRDQCFKALAQLDAVQNRTPDEISVDNFADAMKKKMASSSAKGRSGWDQPDECDPDFLRHCLREHIAKGDPVDVGNFAMMLFNRNEPTSYAAEPMPQADWEK